MTPLTPDTATTCHIDLDSREVSMKSIIGGGFGIFKVPGRDA
jgi:hypothetical protein